MEIIIKTKLRCQGSWYSKRQGVILVKKEEDIKPLFKFLCKQDDYWESHKNLIKVAPKEIESIYEIQKLCEYCGKTDIYNVEKLKSQIDFMIYQYDETYE